jgi:hypothetical protein
MAAMDAAGRARSAARDHVDDISPRRLAVVIDDRLGEASMVPGVLTILSARAVAAAGPEPRATADGGIDTREVERRAAGVQLIYEGLRLTRGLVDADPWAGVESEEIPADVDVVAADVLVARGFSLLARTSAATLAVETVREFGSEQADGLAGRPTAARALEANVFELAAVAGATAVGPETPLALRQYAVGLARAHDETPLAAATDLLPETIEDVLERVSEPPTPDRARPRSPD